MKKIIIVSITFSAIAVLASLNVSLVKNDSIRDSKFSFSNIEALAAEGDDAIYGGWGNFFQGQGFYKNEREWPRSCPSEKSSSGSGQVSWGGGIASGGGSSSATNPSGRSEITCPVGTTNCSSIGC